MLQETEWNIINNILLELYSLKEINQFSEKFFSTLKLLIPFTKGCFFSFDDKNSPVKEKSYFQGFSQDEQSLLINKYFEIDTIHYYLNLTKETSVFNDSAYINSEVQKKDSFYNNVQLKWNIPYGLRLVIYSNGTLTGTFSFFKDKSSGDFSDKDVYILNVLKNHAEKILSNLLNSTASNIQQSHNFNYIENKYSLSDREKEVLHLITEGKSNAEICEILFVSLSTVKKHVYNIFNKVGVNSRTQLINLIYSNN